jgi:histidyl-tRNA synthetase
MVMMSQLFKVLSLESAVSLELNSLGSFEERKAYRDQLVEYLTPLQDRLDEDSQRRLLTNPLRILDSKSPETQALLVNAPKMIDSLGEASRARFAKVCQLLDAAGVPYVVNPRLVRGLDYYNHTVFEWVTDRLGAQGTVCAGGRYDGLVEQLGGASTPAFGCAMGMERIILLMKELNSVAHHPKKPKKIFVIFEAESEIEMFRCVTRARQFSSGVECVFNTKGGDFKKQFQRAAKENADVAWIFTAEKIAQGEMEIKTLSGPDQGQQIRLSLDELSDWLGDLERGAL